MKAHNQLLLALFLGAGAGLSLHPWADSSWLQAIVANGLHPAGQLFLTLIFMVVVPLVFSGLTLGVLELRHGPSLGLGQVVRRTLTLTLVTSSTSVFLGMLLVNAFKPGEALRATVALHTGSQPSDALAKIEASAQSAPKFVQILLDLIPKNPLASAVQALDGQMISFMIFTLIFALALSATTSSDAKSTFARICEETFAASMKIVEVTMRFAPLAVFCLVFVSTVKFGTALVAGLLWYIAVVLLGLGLQMFVVYSGILKLSSNITPTIFFRKTKDVLLYAFATASSNATLPKAIAVAENDLKLNKAASRFVLTVGSTANQNGTALFEGVTVLFLAQAYGIDLSLTQQIQVALMSILAGIGTAGVPGGSLPLILILTQQVGIPAEGLGMILGVDRILDMCRSSVNVAGDLVIASVVGQVQTPAKD